MTTRLEYLKLSINSTIIEDPVWYNMVFAIPVLRESPKEHYQHLEIVPKADGIYYAEIGLDNKPIFNKITDYVKDEPLFKFQEDIELDPSWHPCIQNKMISKIGRLIVNVLVIYPSLGTRIGYINDKIRIKDINKIMANKVVDDKLAKETDISVSQMVNCFNRFTFLVNLAHLSNLATSEKMITPPPGVDKEKEKLLKEYNEQLNDPVKLVELTKKLSEIDQAYLEGDEAAKHILSKKGEIARKKLYLIYGNTMNIDKNTKTSPITQSLYDGVSTDPEDFKNYINDLRSGSYARGSSTQLGGYIYKILQRVLASITISSTPCNTKKGIKRLIDQDNVNKLINRYIKNADTWLLIPSLEDAQKYIGKEVEMRSSVYCTSPGATLCYQCLSETLKNSPTGITIIASDLSAVLLGMFMALMHGTKIESTPMSIDDLVT